MWEPVLSKSHERKDSVAFQWMLYLVYFVCRLLMLTWRVRVVGMDLRRRSVGMSPVRSFVLATFHENAIAGLLSHPNQGIACLASRSKDGEIVASVCDRVGLRTVRGSSSRGGKEARDELIDLLRSGVSAAITVDGPRGPRREAKAGIIDVARKSGAVIVPITCLGERQWVLAKTWDKTRLPRPFTKLLVKYGEPIRVPEETEGAEFEKFRILISETLAREDEILRIHFKKYWADARPFDL